MAERGFAVEPCFCGTCGEVAEGLPDGSTAKGLPQGWVAVKVSRYKRGSGEITSAFDHIRTLYYCSEAHLPSDLLPPAEEE